MDAYIHSTFICCDHKNPLSKQINIGSPPRHNKLLWRQQNPLKYILKFGLIFPSLKNQLCVPHFIVF